MIFNQLGKCLFKLLLDQQNQFMASNATEDISRVEEIYTHERISSPVRVANVPRFVNPAVANVPRFGKRARQVKIEKKRNDFVPPLNLV